MPARGVRGTAGYTFEIIQISTRSAPTKVFELHSKAGGGCIGLVSLSPPHRAYVYRPSGAMSAALTLEDLVALSDFVRRQNAADTIRRREAAG